jgi:translation elongation factor EF-Tu-like GTPase
MNRTVLIGLSMKPEQAGGRHAPFTAGYAPHLVVVGTTDLLGVRAQNAFAVSPGDKAEVSFELMYFPNVNYGRLLTGARVDLVEGPHVVGEGMVLRGG